MIRSESDLWEAIKADPIARLWFTQRFEDRSRAGIPDAFIGSHKRRLWLELKCGPSPVWRKGQLAWAISAADRGERVACLRWHRGKAHIIDMAAHGVAVVFGEPTPMPLLTHGNPALAVAWALDAFPAPAPPKTRLAPPRGISEAPRGIDF